LHNPLEKIPTQERMWTKPTDMIIKFIFLTDVGSTQFTGGKLLARVLIAFIDWTW